MQIDMAAEAARLDVLRQLNLLDTPPSESFDRITRMAAQVFGLPVAAVSLTDHDRQWFKSRVGIDHWSIPRETAPCAEVALTRQTLVLPDLLEDECYATSVLAGQGVRFYAGAPLITSDGHGLGALCVLGTEPREVTEAEMAALSDLAAMVMSQIELQHAFGRIDAASGLPNRVQLREDLDDLARDDAGAERLMVLIDLARAEQLNSGLRVLGPSYVDTMVEHAARLIRGAVPAGTRVYHVSATQFALLAPAGADPHACLAAIHRHLAAGNSRHERHLAASISIGAAPFAIGEGAAADILRGAYGAALDARARKLPFAVYSAAEDDAHQRRYRLLHDFETALTRPGQLRLAVQPRIDVASGRCVGGEALLRWRHPTLGDVSPAEFIPIVEHSALAATLTRWVIETAATHLATWQRAGLALKLSVNIFAANLDEPDFADLVQSSLKRHHVAAGSLELELTESAAIADTDRSMAQLAILAEAGIGIAIDDFGTGYSSLAYLQSLPADTVKIDQSFVRGIEDNQRAAALVASMVALSRGLGYRVVAEGVETAQAMTLLKAIGCDEAQGYLLARPMDVDAFEAWVAADDQESVAA
ncbi:putative bifunctional diguanylate cyclase/phosphodiesterase [Allosphingosinicella deserti]|uniref:Sensor domain-containing phosphodiesterase n=1 Tax=Allosphingosinicella deserti TaxID=2116704 RepID=A0A2P7QR62_9SPHN|nr:GGDEF and EAL domain-containing protein [Sphingomonas deserti]PSJ40452.1 sensor domain-containing phosphodiesterase [Sphingomonas deserti]